jgi:hypothetical protein
VASPKVTLLPGQTTYDVAPTNFEADCPAGYTAVGTGFDGDGVVTTSYLESYGFFVGGFMVNDSSISATAQIFGVCAQGSSGAAPFARIASGAAPAPKTASGLESDYHAKLQALAAKAQ